MDLELGLHSEKFAGGTNEVLSDSHIKRIFCISAKLIQSIAPKITSEVACSRSTFTSFHTCLQSNAIAEFQCSTVKV